MPFLMQRKKGAGVGRVFAFASIANQPHALENKYVPGSGVGASSISTRRALSRRALSRRATIANPPSFTVGNVVDKARGMKNALYTYQFNPQNFSPLFPNMEPFIAENIVAGDKGEDRLMASYWEDLGSDIFDNWGFFYLYDVNSGKYYFPLINPQNGDDGVIYTQTFNAFERTFTIKHGWAAQGIFKFDISVADSLPFRFGAYGNIDQDYDAESLTHNYSIGGQNKTLYYYNYYVLNESPGEQLYSYWIPKENSENSAQTYDVYYDDDDMSMRSKEVTSGLIVYFAKTNNVKDWVINDLGSLLS